MPSKRHIIALVLLGTLLSGCTGQRSEPATGELAPDASRYALVISVSEYQDPKLKVLPSLLRSAKETAAVLEEVAGFPAKNVELLSSAGKQKPTRANILAALGVLARKAKPGGLVLIYYGGHGIEVAGNVYLLPWDSKWRSKESAPQTFLPVAEVSMSVNKISCRTAITIFETCRNSYSDVFRGKTSKLSLPVEPNKKPDENGPSSTVTCFSSSSGQTTFVGNKKRSSILSYYLQKGLRRDAADQHGVVRVKNLFPYLSKAVYGTVRLKVRQVQRPIWLVTGDRNAAQDLVLAVGRPPGSGGETAVVSTPNMTRQEKFRAALQQGYEALMVEKGTVAQSRFQEALRYQSGSFPATFELALLYLKHDPADRRVGLLYLQCLKSNPRHAYAHAVYAWYSTRYKHDYDGGEHYYRIAANLAPRWSDPVLRLGLLEQRKKHFAAADRLFRRAIALKPRGSLEHGRYALFLLKRSQREAAIKEAKLARQFGASFEPGMSKKLGLK